MADPVQPTPIPAWPEAPTPLDEPAVFNQKAFAQAAALQPQTTAQNASAAATYTNAQSARDDRVQTQADRIATGQDRAATGQDRAATGQDRAATGQDRAAIAQAEANTAQDRIATGQDRVATGQDRAATLAYRNQAEIFATQQTVATSSTDFANTIGVKSLTLTAGKPFVPNVTFLRGASRSNSNAKNGGYVTEYNVSTGAAKIAISEVFGSSANFSDWDFALGSPGGTPGISIVTPDTVTNCNDLPGNTITRITSTNSTASAKNLPILIANDGQTGWAFNIAWTIETIGFDTLYKTQIAIPMVAGNNVGAGLTFVRKLENGTWGRWCPQGRMPSSLITTAAGHFYDPASGQTSAKGDWGLNRINVLTTSLTTACDKYMPINPVEGDRFTFITNHRNDTRLYPTLGVGIRTGDVAISADADTLTLDSPFTAYSFIYSKDHAAWFLG